MPLRIKKFMENKEYSVASFQLATTLVLVPIHHKLTDKTKFLNKQISEFVSYVKLKLDLIDFP